MSAADKASDKAAEVKTGLAKTLDDNGIVNPSGLAFLGFGGIFIAAVPVMNWLASPNGFVERAVNALASTIVYAGTAGSQTHVTQTNKIAALSSLYIAFAFGISGAWSVAGQASARKNGHNMVDPRRNLGNLRGLPLRLYSAHSNLIEMFGGFALSAALAQTLAPGDQVLINLLGLHVIAKMFVFYPSYIANVPPTRSLGHLIATSSVIGAVFRLATL